MKKFTILAILCLALLIAGCVPQEEQPAQHVHKLVHMEAVAPTCTDAGRLENWFCFGCNTRFADAEATKIISALEVAIPKLAHTPAEDDGDCTTAVACTECEMNAVEAKETHTGGTATCVRGKLCDTCGKEYGEKDPEAHTFADGACTACGITGGYCGKEGENAAWTLKDGVFTLYGVGEVNHYSMTQYPWYDMPMESVVVKDGITNIPTGAFYLADIKTATIPGSVTTIDNHAFLFCTKLQSVTLSEGLQTIGDSAFSECYALNTIHIPASVTNIGFYAFPNNLEEITVAEGGTVYCSIDGSLYKITDNGLNLEIYAPGPDNTSFVTPEGVTVINTVAFDCEQYLRYVTISADVQVIMVDAFQICSLKEITILSEDIVIDTYAFASCDSIGTINYVGTQEQWDEMALELPEGVTVNCDYVPYE